MNSLCVCKNECKSGKYLEVIIDHSVIARDKIIDAVRSEPAKTMSVNFNDKKVTFKLTISLFYLHFY